MNDPMQEQDIQMDAANLAREDVFTDSRIGTIRRLTPVTAEGEVDASREVQYIGSTQIMTPAGALPLTFELPNESLAAAVEGFAPATEDSPRAAEARELAQQLGVAAGKP